MSSIVRALKSIYDFFAGDHIILSGVAVAFVAAALLTHFLPNFMAVVVVIFVVLIIGGLVLTLAREKKGQEKTSE